MKRLLASALLLGVFGLSAQTITVNNQSGVLLSDIIFTSVSNQEITISFYGAKTVNVPDGAVKFRIVSPSVYRDASTNAHAGQIAMLDVPIMTSDDLAFRVTLEGSVHDAPSAELCVEEIY